MNCLLLIFLVVVICASVMKEEKYLRRIMTCLHSFPRWMWIHTCMGKSQMQFHISCSDKRSTDGITKNSMSSDVGHA